MKLRMAKGTQLAATEPVPLSALVEAPPAARNSRPSPAVARRILLSLMVPSLLMPLTSSMARVALPIIRDDFGISADMTAWVATVFSLPFMILMPVYGRLSDGVGRRRLLLAGLVIFSVGTLFTILATDLAWIMAGRALQGIGTAGIMPLGMALISTIFRSQERGKALGTWSSIGPTTAFIGPLVAGFLVVGWGWRAAFAPPLLAGIAAFIVVAKFIPPGLSNVRLRFLRTFDWTGVLLRALSSTFLLFYLASRPITGVASLTDWRLLAMTVFFMSAFIWWERRHRDPFVALDIFRNSLFTRASTGASLRMFTMGAGGFLFPLYLVDIHGLNAAYIGLMSMIMPGSMALIVRFGGQIADRWGSRWPVMAGFAIQIGVMLAFSRQPANASLWSLAIVLFFGGLGVGLMLAALHRSAMGDISDEKMGAAAGVYSMIRFAGMVIGTALAGVMLQMALDRGLPTIDAYQSVYLAVAGVAFIGLVLAFTLKEPTRSLSE